MAGKPRSREWIVDANDLGAVQGALEEVTVLLLRAGGAVAIQTGEGVLIIGAGREQVDAVQLQHPQIDLYETAAFVFRWEPFMPSARRVDPAEARIEKLDEEPTGEPEPAEEPAAA